MITRRTFLSGTLMAALGSPASASEKTTSRWPTFQGNMARHGVWEATLPTNGVESGWSTVLDGSVYTPPVHDGTRLFVPGSETRLTAIFFDDGSVIWENTELGTVAGSPTFHDDTLFVTTQDGVISAINPKNGDLRWETDLGTWCQSRPVTGDGTVFAIASETLMAIDKESGEQLWMTSLDNPAEYPAVLEKKSS